MSTTIDPAGRLVVPKAVRDAMGLKPGVPIDIVYIDGRIQIEFAPIDATVDASNGLPVITTSDDVPPLTSEEVRATLETTRR
ncbi:AbrB/MazE/SpoVT family DNA-binding domain-containing protein [Microbacterium sp. KR10-403]|uniref:AbrB/MazE/SpoVT family DNA-binding domain-containing protein n=1 Tax=Microbacterium sp. KR10-403 TaxID=3158581 RepID=UPI0032E3704A